MRLTEREQAFLACSCWISGSLAGCLCLFGLMASAFLAARLFPTSQSCAEPGSQGCFGDMTRKGERAFLPSASRAWELDGCQSQGCRGMWPMSQDNDGIPAVLLILERFFLPLLTSSSPTWAALSKGHSTGDSEENAAASWFWAPEGLWEFQERVDLQGRPLNHMSLPSPILSPSWLGVCHTGLAT